MNHYFNAYFNNLACFYYSFRHTLSPHFWKEYTKNYKTVEPSEV